MEYSWWVYSFKNPFTYHDDKREICLRLFASSEDTLLGVLGNRKLTHTLKEVEEYRNVWKGHGGIVVKKNTKDAKLYWKRR